MEIGDEVKSMAGDQQMHTIETIANSSWDNGQPTNRITNWNIT